MTLRRQKDTSHFCRFSLFPSLAKNRLRTYFFNYDKTDYVSWAVGLQKAGYATDPNYAKKLISLVKKYELDILDTMEDPLRKLRELD